MTANAGHADSGNHAEHDSDVSGVETADLAEETASYRAECVDGDSHTGSLEEGLNWAEEHFSMLEALDPDGQSAKIEIVRDDYD